MTPDKPKILVLEDELLVALDMAAALSRLGCTVVGPVPRVAAALRLVREEALSGAILDVNVGGSHSFEVADALSQRGVPFVFATGYGADFIPKAYRQQVCLVKPIGREEIARVVETVFGVVQVHERQS